MAVLGAAATLAAAPSPALAAPGDPVEIADGVSLDPIVDGRLRYERVDQPATDADAVTFRLRAGFELKHESGFSLLAESEATLGIVKDYNAFPFVIVDNQRRPQFSTVPDPMNIELNRLQLQYKAKDVTLTIGRQRMILDDQRWVGAAGWRQNEQTFDAARAEAKLGPVSLDAAYALGQRTVFGVDAGPRKTFDGNFVFFGAWTRAGPVTLKGFAYLLDYDEGFLAVNSSQTYGIRATSSLPLGGGTTLNLAGSWARQSDYGSNPFDYRADYAALQGAVTVKQLTLTGGWEMLGSDNGRAVQTPMASLHIFNGWADVFLTTPDAGLRDWYGALGYKFSSVKALPGLNASVTYHRFESDTGSLHYGNEWDASVGFRLGRVNLLAKYADYNARHYGVDTAKFWLQADFAY